MPTVTINGTSIDVPRGTPIIRAAAMLGFNIPHFCYHPAMSSPANCRMCLVEVEKARKLEPSCYLKCTEGMVVHTESPKVVAARRSVMEFILVNHPVDCPICDQAGECKLQDYYMAYDHRPSRLTTQKVGKVKAYPIGPHVVYDGERCILCTRCVRFCDEITGTSELTVVERGDRSEIRTFPGRELDNAYSMNVTDLCPVGALTTRDFRFKCRVWLLSSADSICTGCSRGCSVHMEHYQGEVQRYRPRFNPDVNEYWLCDQGRLSYRHLHTDRHTQLRLEGREGVSWPRAVRQLVERIASLKASDVPLALVVSAQASTESLLAARHFAEHVLRPVRVYWSGRPDGEADSFLVRSDKNPNRTGIRAVFGDETVETSSLSQLQEDLSAGRVQGVWWMGAEVWLTGSDGERLQTSLAGLRWLVVQASHQGPVVAAAHTALPVATHAEQSGTYLTEDGIAQQTQRAFAPQHDALADWEVFERLCRAAGAPIRGTDPWHTLQNELDAVAGAAE
jgi:NADH-quinone oxidoreductase subunit G